MSIIQKKDKIKDYEKEEYRLPLGRENSPWLEESLKEGIWKVAFESEDRTPAYDMQLHWHIPVCRQLSLHGQSPLTDTAYQSL